MFVLLRDFLLEKDLEYSQVLAGLLVALSLQYKFPRGHRELLLHFRHHRCRCHVGEVTQHVLIELSVFLKCPCMEQWLLTTV